MTYEKGTVVRSTLGNIWVYDPGDSPYNPWLCLVAVSSDFTAGRSRATAVSGEEIIWAPNRAAIGTVWMNNNFVWIRGNDGIRKIDRQSGRVSWETEITENALNEFMVTTPAGSARNKPINT